ncbi:toll/interleukin-1 receptor domain-containing protein [Rhizobium sp. 16-449-1b]|uniref:toll/interleukin-1 receptor domain-containing protein n=1 Tax=Rhizobium sp. 16-449-1b TaxID=2819989 RepID=UPI001ADC65B2|nr:toll/interleukin-1 receptor domain-containing protein [Rhizobium sp. 16-449-1b]MBO9197022.1 toll/interleukin-1 receptor domain-containing protein [Rhizobium sp. 16-449-1b]
MAASNLQINVISTFLQMNRIFISHAKEDKHKIAGHMERLVSHGFHLWLDRVYEEDLPWRKRHPIHKYIHSLPIGEVWHIELGKALCDADSLVVFWSRNSVDQSKKPIILMEVAVHLFRGTAYQYYIDDAELPKDVRSQHQFGRESEPGSFEALISQMVRKLKKENEPWNGNGIDTDRRNVRAYWELLQEKGSTGPTRSANATRIPFKKGHPFWLSRRDAAISARDVQQLVTTNPHLIDNILSYDECKAAFMPGGHDWGEDHPYGLSWNSGDATFFAHHGDLHIFRHGGGFEKVNSNISASLWFNRAR